MDYRTPFWERLNERLTTAEKSLRMLEPIENLVELSRLHKDIKQLFFTMKELEEKIYTTKRVLNFEEVCRYIGISDSALYKMTSAGTIPFHKPRGKMLYFDKYEIDEWLLQSPVPVAVSHREENAEPNVEPVNERSEPSSRTALMGEQPNPWNRLQLQDAMSRHRGAKPPRRCELLGEISLLSPG